MKPPLLPVFAAAPARGGPRTRGEGALQPQVRRAAPGRRGPRCVTAGLSVDGREGEGRLGLGHTPTSTSDCSVELAQAQRSATQLALSYHVLGKVLQTQEQIGGDGPAPLSADPGAP